jgi:hypothetical protein
MHAFLLLVCSLSTRNDSTPSPPVESEKRQGLLVERLEIEVGSSKRVVELRYRQDLVAVINPETRSPMLLEDGAPVIAATNQRYALLLLDSDTPDAGAQQLDEFMPISVHMLLSRSTRGAALAWDRTRGDVHVVRWLTTGDRAYVEADEGRLTPARDAWTWCRARERSWFGGLEEPREIAQPPIPPGLDHWKKLRERMTNPTHPVERVLPRLVSGALVLDVERKGLEASTRYAWDSEPAREWRILSPAPTRPATAR